MHQGCILSSENSLKFPQLMHLTMYIVDLPGIEPGSRRVRAGTLSQLSYRSNEKYRISESNRDLQGFNLALYH
jgi:hypothetical protein